MTFLTATRLRDVADLDDVKEAFSSYPAGVAALCARVGDDIHGLVATSFAVGVSLDPPLALVAVRRESATWPLLRDAPRLGVSLLGSHQSHASRAIAAPAPHRFAGVDLVEEPSGAVLVEDASLWFECAIHSETDAGDHLVVLLRLERVGVEPAGEPLLYHRRGYHRLHPAG